LACSSSEFDASDEGANLRPIERSEFCEKTRCDVARDECCNDIEDCENACISGSLDTFESCYAICRGIGCPVCRANDDDCAVWNYRFEIRGAPDPQIDTACERAAAHESRCSRETADTRCSHFARVMNRRAIAVYECYAELPCDANFDACLEEAPSSDLGRGLCGGLTEGCSNFECDAEFVAAFDEVGRWLRPEVTAAALECLNEGCANMDACLWAWLEAVFPPG
jgi:hypothetical protein